MWKKALSLGILVLAGYGAIEGYKEGRAYLKKRKAAAPVATTNV
jgi:hypothetical protein